jgi:beta-aspartyl-peptidase (threonine type)
VVEAMKTPNHFSLMIHGGFGTTPENCDFAPSLRRVAEAGSALLADGGSALDAVTLCVALLEDDPLFNAGRGSVLTAEGRVEMDASIMDGRNLEAGAVAGVRRVRNPVRAARAAMARSGHVFLIGDGADGFAAEAGCELASPDYFVTPARRAQHAQRVDEAAKIGTVGAVARDVAGDLAAATSTGGVPGKRFGRVGDAPVIGAGVFADNASCAVSCTGVGEHFLRMSIARSVGFLVEEKGMDAAAAATEAIRRLVERISGVGGLIVVDRVGRFGRAKSGDGLMTATARPGVIDVETR